MSSLSELQNKLSKEEIKLIREVRKVPFGEVIAVMRDSKIVLVKKMETVRLD